MREADLSRALLDWYDLNARALPWRISPARRQAGERPDPYAVWLSEIMLQQTTAAVVVRRYSGFLDRWPTVRDLAGARDEEVMAAWAGLGYYARARNLVACARIIVERYDCAFPRRIAELRKLPGIGPYTAAAIAAIAFDTPIAALDGNVERVMSRLHAVRDSLPAARPVLRQLAGELAPAERAGDFCQAMMDLGALVCRPRRPDCQNCPWRAACKANEQGLREELPVRRRPAARPTVRGLAFVARRTDGAWLVERRPASGLLGGMVGWPGSGWGHEAQAEPPWGGNWRRLDGTVRHSFTHFNLELAVLVATIPAGEPVRRGEFVPADEFAVEALPTLMRKALSLASPQGVFRHARRG